MSVCTIEARGILISIRCLGVETYHNRIKLNMKSVKAGNLSRTYSRIATLMAIFTSNSAVKNTGICNESKQQS